MWCVDGQVEKGGINLVSLSVYSRLVEIACLLHCQALNHLSLYQSCVYTSSLTDMFWMNL